MEQKTKDQEPEIAFRPLTEGLGINHFSDGLPYANAGQTPARRPQGHFDFPPPRAPRATAPAKQEVVTDLRVESEVDLKLTPVAPLATGTLAPISTRLIAYLCDLGFVALFYIVVMSAGLALAGVSISSFAEGLWAFRQSHPALDLIVSMFGLIYFGYFLLQEVSWGTTLGKSLFRLRLKGGSVFTRALRVTLFLAPITGVSVVREA
ncbi:MAG TPA: RDD family protein [Oligoflexia bacterium]|nr:RDD family protein [Oligoflexia bacterium]